MLTKEMLGPIGLRLALKLVLKDRFQNSAVADPGQYLSTLRDSVAKGLKDARIEPELPDRDYLAAVENALSLLDKTLDEVRSELPRR